MTHMQYRKSTIHDHQGRTIQGQEEYGEHVSNFFSEQFQGDVKQGSTAFTGEPRPLKYPITASEVELAMNRLNNNRASGSDELPGALLKHGSNVIAKPIEVFHTRDENHVTAGANPFWGSSFAAAAAGAVDNVIETFCYNTVKSRNVRTKYRSSVNKLSM